MEQIKFPFKEKEDAQNLIGKVFKGRMPTLEEDDELTEKGGNKPTSQEKINRAKEEAFKQLREKEIIEKKEN